MAYSFTWNGDTSTSKGIRLAALPEIIKPEERVNHVVIPGRAGELTQTEGDDIYNSYIQTIPLIIDNLSDVAAAEKWLRGDGYVTFSGQPALKQRARVINAVTFAKHSKNSSWWEGQVQFYCEPLKQAVTEAAVDVTTSGATINNPGDVTSFPLITITGTGDITIRIRGKSISLTGVESGWKVDSEAQWVTNALGEPLMNVYTGSFPLLPPGESAVQFTGSVTKLTIDRRSRYL